jgi:thiamine-monophosphate kinase
MNEGTFVEQITKLTGPKSVLGDDCAILSVTDEPLLATVDSLSESIHYEGTVDSKPIMRKLVGVNVSDIAAMGGLPRWALFVDGSRDEADVRQDRVRALHRELQNHDIELIGGDTVGVAREGCDHYSLTLLGTAHAEGILERTRAQPGDRICVTGSLGAPAAVRSTATPPWTQDERNMLYDPPNRVQEGRELVEFGCRSAIDLSDGLVKDLKRILRQSEVGAQLNWTEVPVDDRARHRAENKIESLGWALTGGEDFELLFILPPVGKSPSVQHTQIGRVTDGSALSWVPSLPEKLTVKNDGYDHLL